MSYISRNQIAMIQIAKNQLGLSDKDYRALLVKVAGVNTSKKIPKYKFTKLKKELQALGWVYIPKKKGKRTDTDKECQYRTPSDIKSVYIAKVRGILRELDKTIIYGDGVMKNMFGVDRLEFGDNDQIFKVYQALCVYKNRQKKIKENIKMDVELKFYQEKLDNEECVCFDKKKKGRPFCYSCYARLPDNLQQALFSTLTNGFPQAYKDAVKFLGY